MPLLLAKRSRTHLQQPPPHETVIYTYIFRKCEKGPGAERTVVPRAPGGQTAHRRRRRRTSRFSFLPRCRSRCEAGRPAERAHSALGSAVGRRRVCGLCSIISVAARSQASSTWRRAAARKRRTWLWDSVSAPRARSVAGRPLAMCAKCAPCVSLRPRWIYSARAFLFVELSSHGTKCCCSFLRPSWCCFRRFSCKVSAFATIAAYHVGNEQLQFLFFASFSLRLLTPSLL